MGTTVAISLLEEGYKGKMIETIVGHIELFDDGTAVAEETPVEVKVTETPVDVNKKVWTKDEIVALLGRSNLAVERGTVAIFNLQTSDEQSAERTSHHNGVGYNGLDANIMSSFAKQILDGRHLSFKQLEIARKKLIKYSRQLIEIANSK